MDSPGTVTNMSLSCFNVFAGSNIGYLKGVNFDKKNYRNLNSAVEDKSTRDRSITCLCWGNEEETCIFAGHADGDIFQHNLITETSHSLNLASCGEDGQLKSMKLQKRNLISAFSNGVVKVFDLKDRSIADLSSDIDPLLAFNSYSEGEKKNLQCMDRNISNPNSIVTGGNENGLKVWDVNASEAPIFTAKNVKNNWLNLRVPVWVTNVAFYPEGNKVVSGTGFGAVRLYDPSSSQRRPAIEVKCGEYPLTGLCVRPNSDFEVIVGDTTGFVASVDLRKKATVKTFKGTKGGITDIVAHPIYPVFTVSSVDRFVYCYNADKSSSCNFINSVYVKNSLNCLLCSSSWQPVGCGQPESGTAHHAKSVDSKQLTGTPGLSEDEVVSDNDDIWDNMEVVGKKIIKRVKSQDSGTLKPKTKKKKLR